MNTVVGSLENKEFVSAWLNHRIQYLCPGADSVGVVAVKRMSRGISRQTWSVDVVIDNKPVSIMVRRDHADGSVIPTELRAEYETYLRLNDCDVPTARVLWFEDDEKWQPDGRPAYVRELIEGDWHLPFLDNDLPEFDAQRVAASKAHLSLLARLHTADWEKLGFGEILPVPTSAADNAKSLIERCIRDLAEYQFEPSPVVAEGIAQLLERAPRDAQRISLCKGTNGHGEEVWRDGHVVAMSDWELAILGDPAYDFALLQDMIPEIVRGGDRIWGWPEALAFYREKSGIEITEERIEYYRAVNGLIQFMFTHHAASQMRKRPQGDLRFLWVAWEPGFRSHLRIAQRFGFAPDFGGSEESR